MIFGIGTDIVAVSRLRDMWQRHGEHALARLLAADEYSDFAAAADKAVSWPSALPPRKRSPKRMVAGCARRYCCRRWRSATTTWANRTSFFMAPWRNY